MYGSKDRLKMSRGVEVSEMSVWLVVEVLLVCRFMGRSLYMSLSLLSRKGRVSVVLFEVHLIECRDVDVLFFSRRRLRGCLLVGCLDSEGFLGVFGWPFQDPDRVRWCPGVLSFP